MTDEIQTPNPAPASAPSSDGPTTASPAAGTAPTPEAAKPDTKTSTQPETSPSGDAAKPEGEADPKPEGEKAEGDKGEGEPDPRDVVPDAADGYAVNLDDTQKAALGLSDGDPLVKGLSEWAKEQNWSQGRLDDVLVAASALAAKGLLGAPFDPAAELAKLGENGEGRRTEIETFAEALKSRGDLSEGEHAVLVSLAAEADGVTLIEKLRGRMGEDGQIEAPADPGAGNTHEALLAKAREMRADERYESDRNFRKQADDKFQEAYRAKPKG